MARLVMKYETKVLREIPLRQAVLTIGRVPSNDLVIDNMAVSSAHAKIYLETDKFVLEDLSSLNGTFVNKQRIRKSGLKNGDEISIGKHTLVFMDEGGLPPEKLEPATGHDVPMAKLRTTAVLDTRQHREMLHQASTAAGGELSRPAGERVASLAVLKGKTDQKEYILTAKMAMIGKSPMASVKLKGWFKPEVAAVVMNKEKSEYQVAPSGRIEVKLNGQVISSPQDLKEGDLIEVAGVKLQFNHRE